MRSIFRLQLRSAQGEGPMKGGMAPGRLEWLGLGGQERANSKLPVGLGGLAKVPESFRTQTRVGAAGRGDQQGSQWNTVTAGAVLECGCAPALHGRWAPQGWLRRAWCAAGAVGLRGRPHGAWRLTHRLFGSACPTMAPRPSTRSVRCLGPPARDLHGSFSVSAAMRRVAEVAGFLLERKCHSAPCRWGLGAGCL